MPNSLIQGYFLTIHNPDTDYTNFQNLSYNYTMFTFDELTPDDEHVIIIYAYAHDLEDDITLNGITTTITMRTSVGGVYVCVCVCVCVCCVCVCACACVHMCSLACKQASKSSPLFILFLPLSHHQPPAPTNRHPSIASSSGWHYDNTRDCGADHPRECARAGPHPQCGGAAATQATRFEQSVYRSGSTEVHCYTA